MNVIRLDSFRDHTTPLASIVRIGDFNKQFADFHSLNLLPGRRAVVDAYNVTRQRDLLRDLRRSGFEIVLDTKGAELSCPYKWNGQARHAEWLNDEAVGPLQSDDFNDAMANSIAKLAIQAGAHVVLAPSRYISEVDAVSTLRQDFVFIGRLRAALDAMGAPHIGIAASLISRHTLLGQNDVVDQIVGRFSDSCCTSIWMRLSGLKRDPGPSRIRTLARRLEPLKTASKPVILDYAGGLEPLSLLSMGVASGVSFGVLKNDQFRDESWVRPSKSKDNSTSSGFQQFRRAPALGRNLSQAELQLLSEAPKGKRVLFEPARTGVSTFEDFSSKAKEIALKEAVGAVSALAAMPDTHRPLSLRQDYLEPAARKARQLSRLRVDTRRAAELKVDPDSLSRRLNSYAQSLDKTCTVIAAAVDDPGNRLTSPIPLPHTGETVMPITTETPS